MLYVCCVCRTKHPVAMAVLSGTLMLLVAGAWLISVQPAVEAKKGPLVTDIVRTIIILNLEYCNNIIMCLGCK